MNAIIARGLGKAFGGPAVLRALDLEVPVGSIYGLLGRNGAGKTTLMKLAMGFLRPGAGELRVLGHDPMAGGAGRPVVGYVASPGLLPAWPTLEQLLRFEASVRQRFERARLDAWIAREGLRPQQRISALSKGQRQRLELELALAAVPAVLLLDEPFDGLDPLSRAEATEGLLGHVASTSATVLISSHVLADLERICDRIGLLAGGRIAFEAELELLKESVACVSGSGAPLPLPLEVIGERADGRGHLWLVRSVLPEQEELLRARGYQLVRPSLVDLGTELLRCFEAGEVRP